MLSDSILEILRPPSEESRDTEPVVWVLGAGFSKPLGGPLFNELLGAKTDRWVKAWFSLRDFPADFYPRKAISTYEWGIKARLWANVEECLALLDEGRSDPLVGRMLNEASSNEDGFDPQSRWIDLSQYVAVATSYFVDRVRGRASLPESWAPYLDWAQCLGPHDSILSFNYDRVVEELVCRSGVKPALLAKLHGSVPPESELFGLLREGRAVESISTPGPQKVLAAKDVLAGVWSEARAALEGAKRLVVIGYSFPPSDAFARSFILKHSAAKSIQIVVGRDPGGTDTASMFQHFNCDAVNTKQLAQEFLAEGSARPHRGRFNHGLNRKVRRRG